MQDYKFIQLVNGGQAIVDADDYERLSKFKWFRSSGGYAYRQGWSGTQRDASNHWTIWLHREVNGTPDGLFTDHVNGAKLDDRKANLRTVNKAQNSANRPKIGIKNPSSAYKGVSFHPSTSLWRARIRDGSFERTTYHITDQQAALDYNRMATERFGQYAQLNVLPNGITPTIPHKKSSQYRGVSKRANSNLWRAALEKDGKGINLGEFKTELEAAIAYNNGALLHFGTRAKLNPICQTT